MNNVSKVLAAGGLTLGILGSFESADAARFSTDKKSVLVEKGDTLRAIARVSGVAEQKIAKLNRLANPDRIRVGQRLILVEPVDPNALTCPADFEKAADITPGCSKVLLGKLAAAGYLDKNPRLAVRAYQQLNLEQHLAVDGRLGPLTASAIMHDTDLAPVEELTIANGFEIDVSDQVGRYIKAGAVQGIVAVTTGSGKPYEELGTDGKLHKGTATTPLGIYSIGRTKDANYHSPLGAMPYAVFMHSGKYDTPYAVHGGVVNTDSTDGLSHGCVRVDDALFNQQFLTTTLNAQISIKV